ncbi:hypothetical protein STZ1_20954 [Bacillus subtilis]
MIIQPRFPSLDHSLAASRERIKAAVRLLSMIFLNDFADHSRAGVISLIPAALLRCPESISYVQALVSKILPAEHQTSLLLPCEIHCLL